VRNDGWNPLHSRRRALRLLQPLVQLKLPFYWLLVTITFTAAFGIHTYLAYNRIYAAVASYAPKAFEKLIQEQTQDFLVVSAAIATGYVLFVIIMCIAYLHRLVGPTTALRRHVEALKNGDYSARVDLRKTDTVFLALEQDLNELAGILERNEKGVP
jgi:nitrogen fixation/metabolism regulation signal transduction histidine kinase